MKRKLFNENLIYVFLIMAILFEGFNTLVVDNYIPSFTSASTSNIILSSPIDATIPTEEELLAKMTNIEKFFYFLNKTKKIAHAGGSVNGVKYTNSIEALNSSYEKGYRIFEIDMVYTSDNHLVLAHGFSSDDYISRFGIKYDKQNPIMDYKTFMKTKLFGKYTTVSIEDLVEFMKTHKDVFIIPDLKNGDNINIVKSTYQDIIKTTNGNKDILNRIVGTYLSTKAYNEIKSIYQFELQNLHFREASKLESNVDTIDKFYKFCLDNNIQLTTMDKSLFSKQVAEYYKDRKVSAILFTSDSEKTINSYINLGASAMMTNN